MYGDDEVEEFYQQLNKIAKAVPKTIIREFRYWNAKNGPDAYQQRAETMGKSGLGETNDMGIRLLPKTHLSQNLIKKHIRPRGTDQTVCS